MSGKTIDATVAALAESVELLRRSNVCLMEELASVKRNHESAMQEIASLRHTVACCASADDLAAVRKATADLDTRLVPLELGMIDDLASDMQHFTTTTASPCRDSAATTPPATATATATTPKTAAATAKTAGLCSKRMVLGLSSSASSTCGESSSSSSGASTSSASSSPPFHSSPGPCMVARLLDDHREEKQPEEATSPRLLDDHREEKQPDDERSMDEDFKDNMADVDGLHHPHHNGNGSGSEGAPETDVDAEIARALAATRARDLRQRHTSVWSGSIGFPDTADCQPSPQELLVQQQRREQLLLVQHLHEARENQHQHQVSEQPQQLHAPLRRDQHIPQQQQQQQQQQQHLRHPHQQKPLFQQQPLKVDEQALVHLAVNILLEHGTVPVGKMGSLLHKAARNHALPAMLKERFGGLKKFLQKHDDMFVLGDDHRYNPHVSLRMGGGANGPGVPFMEVPPTKSRRRHTKSRRPQHQNPHFQQQALRQQQRHQHQHHQHHQQQQVHPPRHCSGPAPTSSRRGASTPFSSLFFPAAGHTAAQQCEGDLSAGAVIARSAASSVLTFDE